MITDEMVKAALKAEEEYHASNDISYTSEGMRRALSAAIAAMPQEPVAWPIADARQHVAQVLTALGREDRALSVLAGEFDDVIDQAFKASCGAVSSLASPVQGATAVKGLEWYPDPGAFPHNTWGAQSSFGRFIIEEVSASDSPAYEARYTPHHLITIKDSLEDAKAAAQTDFERRVRSCLTDAPAVPSEEDEPSQDEIDAWLLANCGAGIPHGEAETEGAMLHGLAYVLRQIEHAPGYRPNIGQVASATSALRMALNRFALIALRNSRAKGAA